MTQPPAPADRLGDFTADTRILGLTLLAVLAGAISAVVALGLVRLIGLVTNLAYFHRVAGDLASPAASPLGATRVLLPAAGGLVVGLMARYGSERIRGHGIPEALEAILIGRSRMAARVAVLKPLSSAIAIGTGGPFGAEGPLLTGRLGGGELLGLAITKAVIWAVALGSGTSGGVLAPLLIMGGSLGALEAHWVHAGQPGLWAAVSMGAVMGGTMRAPFTAVAFLLELTHDVTVLPELFAACIAADAVTVLLMKRSILTEKVARRGYHVMREYSVSPLHRLRVSDVMETDVPAVPADLPLDTLFRRLAELDPVLGRRQAWPVVDDAGRLAGIVTRGDLVRALDDVTRDGVTVLDAGTRTLVVTYPDELLDRAITKMLEHDVGRLPVVRRDDPTRLVGYLGRAGVVAAWLHAAREERDRESGWLAAQLGLLRETFSRR
jgi:CBS domain-containing protein